MPRKIRLEAPDADEVADKIGGLRAPANPFTFWIGELRPENKARLSPVVADLLAGYASLAQSMKTITGAVEGDLSVSEHLILRGMVTGIITVKQGGSLDLHGMCGKSLIVNAGGKATVHGMVNEDVTNRGGDVSVFGMVVGSIDTQSGETHIAPSAVVQNKRSSLGK